MKRIFLTFYFLLFTFYLALTQDIHFSQFQSEPLLLNPALTGNFRGDYRVGANYRNQWKSVTDPFKTSSVFFDHRINKPVIENDYLGTGIVLFSDKSGIAQLSNLTVQVSQAYHKRLGAEDQHLASGGVYAAFVQKSVDYSNLKFHNQYISVNFSPEMPSGETFPTETFSYFDLGAGIHWETRVTESFRFSAGGTFFHLTRPKESFYNAATNKLNSRVGIHASATYLLNPVTLLSPALFYQSQAKDKEFNIGGYVQRELKKTALSTVSVFTGAYMRMTEFDALIWIGGIELNNFRGAISYDFNSSSLKEVSHGKGAGELSLIYIFNTRQSIAIKKTIPCKRL